ncbi:MAG: efflux RND transporter periplasmic adaptor subunit [Pirellulales bacterium]|nr:efflux RND transporter periplasmic adaptor subunit [Pirellulales bacterium]
MASENQNTGQSDRASDGKPIDVRDGNRAGFRKRNRRITILLPLLAVGIALLAVGVVAGYGIAMRRGSPESPSSSETPSTTTAATLWTCSMHPEVKLPKPGKCPKCFMDLIPLEEDSDDVGPRQLKMSREAIALADIQTTPVKRQYVSKLVRMVGKIQHDETGMIEISARVAGRLERLYVDYTGIAVGQGDHLVEIYSPELVVAQRELLQTWKARSSSTTPQRQSAEATLAATEEKLRLLGLLDEQIEQIKDRGTPLDNLTIYAPSGGIVIQKHRNEGDYVKTGEQIYTIVDLSRVWVYLDAYESDIPWIRYGQQVEFATESYPADLFTGTIAFVDPVLNEKTRTARVRVNVANEDLRLKPGMFVRAMVRSRLAAGGRVFDASLAGKWVSPMHPEVVKDGPGKCDVCGMDLVPAEQLGLVPKQPPEPPLTIPASAPLLTGKRAVVYVQPDPRVPVFEGREVTLGYRAGDWYLVQGGLQEGELVVTSGNFKIDSAMQILAKPSMMSLDGQASLHVPEAFHRELAAVFAAYLRLQEALADDRPEEATAAWSDMREALAAVPTETLDRQVEQTWQPIRARLEGTLADVPDPPDPDLLRERFEGLSQAMLQLVDTFGNPYRQTLHEAYCPMAFGNRGASWLQAGDTIANPYFGHQMLRCGETRRQWPAAPASVPTEEDSP